MIKKAVLVLVIFTLAGCVVVPEKDYSQSFQCGLSTDKKVLKVVNLMDGDTSFYAWNDEFFSIISMPTSAIVSSTYVMVNNIYHLGEKVIRCEN